MHAVVGKLPEYTQGLTNYEYVSIVQSDNKDEYIRLQMERLKHIAAGSNPNFIKSKLKYLHHTHPAFRDLGAEPVCHLLTTGVTRAWTFFA